MSDVIPVSVEWLSLREEADARSRSRLLARKAARMTRAPVVVHDLGSGTGSMMRWLAPLLPGPQTWVLHDWNHALLDHAAQRASDATGQPAVVRTSVRDVGQLRESDLAGASLVTMSALLDVLTLGELETVVGACVAARAPALFALSVTGRVDLDTVRSRRPGLRIRVQRPSATRDRGPGSARAGCRRNGHRSLPRRRAGRCGSPIRPWRLGAAEPGLVGEWLEGWVAAAVEERPALEEWADEYLQTRTAQLIRGTLGVVVHHQDLLAWPP